MDNGQVQPVPKRWWWRKRIGILLAAFLLTIGFCYGLWDRHATKVLAEQTDAIRARSEPLAWHELQPPPVPAAENAALLYQDAAAAWENALASLAAIPSSDGGPPEFDADELEKLVGDVPTDKAKRNEHRREIARIFELSKPARDLCRQARPLKRADWGMNFSGPALMTMFPTGLGTCRQQSRLLATTALYAHDTGNDAEGVETLRDILSLVRAVGETPILVNALVEIACTSLAPISIEPMLPTLKVGAAPAASREQVRALIDELMDDRAQRKHIARAYMGERSMQFDTFERFRRGEFGGPQGMLNMVSTFNVGGAGGPAGKIPIYQRIMLKLFDPMFKLDEVRSLRYMTAYVDAAGADDYPTCRRLLPQQFEVQTGPRRITGLLSSILTPSLGRAQVLHFRTLASRRMAAVALAIRLYEIDHGRRPAKLADLLPKYLDKLPADPFRGDGATFAYLPDAERPMLYAVGPDGVDDGGRYGFSDTSYNSGNIDPDVLDWPFFLDGEKPTRQP